MNTIEEAKNLLEQGDIQQGRQILLGITKAEPDNSSAWLLLCGISTRTQDWELGILSFRNLVNLRPRSALASSGLVQSLMESNRPKEALKEIQRFRSIADSESEEVQIVLQEHRGIEEKINKSME